MNIYRKKIGESFSFSLAAIQQEKKVRGVSVTSTLQSLPSSFPSHITETYWKAIELLGFHFYFLFFWG